MGLYAIVVSGVAPTSPLEPFGQGMVLGVSVELALTPFSPAPAGYKLIMQLNWAGGGTLGTVFGVAHTTVTLDGTNTTYESVFVGSVNGGAPLGATLDLECTLFDAGGAPTGDVLNTAGFCAHDPISGIMGGGSGGGTILSEILAAVRKTYP